ncbi:hypothetical protein AAHN97_09340 [Chitinophaga niabensis]|uniref:hypothetical protein n=1 Tax=Chitinophaga niabensis TaxID=536979 RepID=UPI0031BB15CF
MNKIFFTLFFFAFVVTSFYACKKDGELTIATAVINFTITSFSTNAGSAFEVVVNNDLVEDSLFNGNTATKLIPKAKDMQHVLIKDRATGTVLIDTLLNMPGKKAALTLLQLDADRDPVLVGQTDENIPDNHRLQAFFHTNDVLPDAIGVQIYACHYDPVSFTLVKTDTLATFKNIKKGVLSEFLLIKDNADPATIVYFYQPLDVNTLQPLANMGKSFDPANYSGYQFSFDPGSKGTEKHYINNFTTWGNQDLFDVFSDRLISY